MNRTDLIETLLGIDEEAWLVLGTQARKSHVVVVGGAAFMLQDLTSRHTTQMVRAYEDLKRRWGE